MTPMTVQAGSPPVYYAFEINDHGQVAVMTMNNTAGIWQDGSLTVIGTQPGGQPGAAMGINDAGMVVGAGDFGGGMHPFLWTPAGGIQDLGVLVPGTASYGEARDINENGVVIGTSYGYDANFQLDYHALRWTAAGGLEDLGRPAGSTAVWLLRINDAGEATGWAEFSGYTSAVRWSPTAGWTVLSDLLGPGVHWSRGWDISNTGIVVGGVASQSTSSPCAPDLQCAIVWYPNGSVVKLPTPPGASAANDVVAFSLNESGQAAGGASVSGVAHPFLWMIPAAGGPALPQPSTNGPYAGLEGSATVAFDASSTPPFGQPLTFTWGFGDNSPAESGVQTTHTYLDGRAAPYLVTLSASDGNQSGFVTSTATITNLPPVVELTANSPVYTNRSLAWNGTVGDPGTLDAPWDYEFAWGDGTTSNGSVNTQGTLTASHSYSTAGQYTLILTVVDKDGGVGADTISVVVVLDPEAPIARINGPHAAGEGSTITFDATTSTDPQGDPMTFTWNFGDGSPAASGTVVTHVYQDNLATPYQVVLTATDANGLAGTATTTATIANVAPTVSMVVDTGRYVGDLIGVAITFSDPGTKDKNWEVTCSWGDGRPSQVVTLTTQGAAACEHTYGAQGPFILSVSVQDKDGGNGSTQIQVFWKNVNQAPIVVTGGPYSGVEGSPITLDGSQSSDLDGDPITFEWNFNDGSAPATTSVVTHTYADNGTVAPFLEVTDSHGSTTYGTATVTLANANPVLAANPDRTISRNTTLGINVGFQDPGLSDGPFTVTQQWGDGTSTTVTTNTQGYSTPTPIGGHLYTTPGVYQAVTTVTDKDGGVGTDQFVVTVTSNQPPIIKAGGPYSGNEGASIKFSSAGTTDPNGGPLAYRWVFGDGGSSTLLNPSHVYADNGNYTVTLTVTDNGGLTGVATRQATIKNVVPKVTITAISPTTNTRGSTFSMRGSFTDPGSTDAPWTWSITWGDGTPPTTGTGTPGSMIPATHVYNKVGTWTVKMTVTDKNGGRGTSNAITVRVQ